MYQRSIIFLSSIVTAALVAWGLSFFSWSPLGAYLFYIILSLFFLGMLISNQQYEEDTYSVAERLISSFLFSYLIFFRLLYAPFSQFVFGSLVTKESFFSAILSLVLFAIFFALFGTAFLVMNANAKAGFLSQIYFANNEKMFFVLRGLFVSAVLVFALFYLRNSFFSMNSSKYINKFLSPSSCNWTYIRYPNFLSLGRAVSGKNVCLFNYSQDKYDAKYCDLIEDLEVKELCNQFFIPEYEK